MSVGQEEPAGAPGARKEPRVVCSGRPTCLHLGRECGCHSSPPACISADPAGFGLLLLPCGGRRSGAGTWAHSTPVRGPLHMDMSPCCRAASAGPRGEGSCPLPCVVPAATLWAELTTTVSLGCSRCEMCVSGWPHCSKQPPQLCPQIRPQELCPCLPSAHHGTRAGS